MSSVSDTLQASVVDTYPINESLAAPVITLIEPRSGWRLVDWQELFAYRDLFYFLVWRSVKARYSQSALGIGWAIIQPLFSMLVFTVVFGSLAGISSDGAPYAVFSFAALVPWTYFANALTDSTGSLVSNTNLLSKVYFPRLILPLTAVIAKLVDFFIAMAILAVLLVWYQVTPTLGVLALPLLIALMMITAGGMGMWLTSLAVQYRDVSYAIGFATQLFMYASPVVYPTSLIPERYRLWYALNPMVGVIEGFRSALLGTHPMPWDLIGMGIAPALLLALTGMMYFRSKERLFADVA